MEEEEEMKLHQKPQPSNGNNKKMNPQTSSNSRPRMNHLAVLLAVFLSLLCSRSSFADILPGSTLYASNPNKTWSSPNATFSLRFIPASAAYSLAIVYSAPAAHIPIWIAGGHTALADAGASFSFSPDGDLRLANGSGAVLWRSNTSGRGASRATLDESGNLILKKGSVSVWTSFEHPVDTLVPSQNLTVAMALSSRSYSFKLNPDGNLNLKWNNNIVYWNLGLNSSVSVNLSTPTLQFQTTGILALNDLALSSPLNMAYSSDFSELDSFRFLRLDADGNLRMYSFSVGIDDVPVVRWTGVSDQCQVYGFCGNMGICSYTDKGPICGCPSRNFVPVDPNDSRLGCKRKVELQACPGNATLLEMDHAMFLTYPPETNTDMYILDISACRFNCLESSLCAASTISASDIGHCYIKTSSFVSGYQSPSIPSTSFVKVCGPALPNPPPASLESSYSGLWKLHSWAVSLSALLSIALLLVLVLAILWLCYCRDGPVFAGLSAQYSLLEYASGAPVQFPYKELQRATKRFRDKLGAGGFGAVYKGVLVTKMVVAVKSLEGIEQGEKQFRMEVATISSTHHLNLVRLVGFCSEGRHRLLVYEFMKNSSLDRCLFASHDELPDKVLNWESRFRIALGAARGITYLHEECRDCIVHCDIKPENILLDENYNAKVSDFGLAKLLNPRDHRHRSLNNVRGTRGYLAPEWLSNLPITSKSDVYSYGMLLLEIISGRRNFEVSQETNGMKFSPWAYEEFDKGNLMGILDKRLIKDDDFDGDQVWRAIQISFWCIQESPPHRPMMSKVVQMLEGIVEVEKPPPPKPAEDPVAAAAGVGINISAHMSTTAASGPEASSRSSLLTAIPSSVSGMSLEGPASALLQQGNYCSLNGELINEHQLHVNKGDIT